jgi:tetratricopeptide (TPR) repeat protein
VSTKFPLILAFTVCACAQVPFEDGVSVNGEVRGSSLALAPLYVELSSPKAHAFIDRSPLDSDGRFHFDHVPPGNYNVRVLTGTSEDAVVEESHRFDTFNSQFTMDLPPRPEPRPISGTVSLRQLQHPVSKKAVRAFAEAQRYSQAHDTSNAAAKLEEALRIDPEFREAHINLGVQYARARRYSESLAQLETALKIGPPEAMVYANLAWVHAALHQFSEAEVFARKAISLEPGNASAQYLLRHALTYEK